MDKISKTARGLDKALSVFRAITTVFLAIGICAFLVLLIASDKLVEMIHQSAGPAGTSSITIDGVLTLRVPVSAWTAGGLRVASIAIIPVFAAILAITLSIIHVLKRILGDMKEGHPFSQNIPARIRQIAYIIFAYAVITPLFPLTIS